MTVKINISSGGGYSGTNSDLNLDYIPALGRGISGKPAEEDKEKSDQAKKFYLVGDGLITVHEAESTESEEEENRGQHA